jgi:uncharacterized membrane protein
MDPNENSESNLRTKCSRLLGIDEIGETRLPALEATVFERQAPWGDSGQVFRVATYTNHIEGLHGLIYQATTIERNFVQRIALIVETTTKNAQIWTDQLQRCRSKKRDRLMAQAECHGFTSVEYQSLDCDRGAILSRHLDQSFPCVPVVSVIVFAPSPFVQFPLCNHDTPPFPVALQNPRTPPATGNSMAVIARSVGKPI